MSGVTVIPHVSQSHNTTNGTGVTQTSGVSK